MTIAGGLLVLLAAGLPLPAGAHTAPEPGAVAVRDASPRLVPDSEKPVPLPQVRSRGPRPVPMPEVEPRGRPVPMPRVGERETDILLVPGRDRR